MPHQIVLSLVFIDSFWSVTKIYYNENIFTWSLHKVLTKLCLYMSYNSGHQVVRPHYLTKTNEPNTHLWVTGFLLLVSFIQTTFLWTRPGFNLLSISILFRSLCINGGQASSCIQFFCGIDSTYDALTWLHFACSLKSWDVGYCGKLTIVRGTGFLTLREGGK